MGAQKVLKVSVGVFRAGFGKRLVKRRKVGGMRRFEGAKRVLHLRALAFEIIGMTWRLTRRTIGLRARRGAACDQAHQQNCENAHRTPSAATRGPPTLTDVA